MYTLTVHIDRERFLSDNYPTHPSIHQRQVVAPQRPWSPPHRASRTTTHQATPPKAKFLLQTGSSNSNPLPSHSTTSPWPWVPLRKGEAFKALTGGVYALEPKVLFTDFSNRPQPLGI